MLNWLKKLMGSPEMRSAPNVIITGVPRSGTTLCCYLLSKVPNAVALNEPLRIGNINDTAKALKKIRRFFRLTRNSLIASSQAMARATESGISDNNFSSNGKREKLVQKRMVTFDKKFDNNCFLAVKHNALFTILLEELSKDYPFFAIIRNPIAVLGSWNSVDVPVASGNVRAAEILEPQLNEDLANCDTLYEKQLHILDWYFKKYEKLEKEQIIRYEDVIRTNGQELSKIHPEMAKLNEELSSRNKSKLYSYQQHTELYDMLFASDNACWKFYDREEAKNLLEI